MIGHDAMAHLPRGQRTAILAEEAKRRKSGQWGSWQEITFPPGTVGPKGWVAEITRAHKCRVFSVLDRMDASGARHLAVTSLSEIRPTWHEMQRIKDEIAGPDATAIEVYPPKSEIVDDANMFHIWVIPGTLPFSLFAKERAEEAR